MATPTARHDAGSMDAALHPSLLAQVRRLGLDVSRAPDDAGWESLLADVSRIYAAHAGDRRRAGGLAGAMVEIAASSGFDVARLTDPVSGLPNRDALVEALRMALRSADDSEVAVLLVSLDGLGRVSDRLGERGGDEVVRNAGARISELLRSVDFVARTEQDEFGILLGGLAGTEPVRAISSRVERAFAEPLVAAGHYVYFTAHVGAALARPGSSAVDALRRGRLALEWQRSTRSHPSAAGLSRLAMSA